MLASALLACGWATALAQHSVTLQADPGGTVVPAGTVALPDHTDLTVEIRPSGGYHVADVTVDGVSVGPVPSYTFVNVMTGHTLRASFHIPWATGVVSYTVGTNSFVMPNLHYQNATTATGEPSRTTSYGLHDVTMFQQPWLTNEIVSIGSGGELTVAFDHPIQDDPLNPYGLDLLVFGNAMFVLSGGRAGGVSDEPGRISVSQDGATWHEITTARADAVFPTLGFTDTPAAQNVNGGTIETRFVTPVDPSITWSNATYAELVALYDGAGGGCGVDIGQAGLEWIRYVRVWQADGEDWSTEIDAFADVAPSLERDLVIASPAGTPIPAAGSHLFTSGQAVTCRVTSATNTLAEGVRVVCSGWRGTGSVPASGTGSVARFTITSPSSLSWNWSTQHWVQAAAATGGSVDVSGAWVARDDALDATATSSNSFTFINWSGDTHGDATHPTLHLPADRPRSVTAHFAVAPPVPDDVSTWLEAHGQTNADAWLEWRLDRDGDGHSGREEFEAGTDPGRSDSVLRLMTPQTAGSSNRLVWLGGPHGSAAPFSAWYATDVRGPWHPIADDLPKSATGTNVLWHSPTGTATSVFYKISVTEEN